MPYATGTVYKIICNVDSKFVYVGSTFNELRHRFQHHKINYRQWISGKARQYCSCFDHFKKYGLENFTIIRIKEYVCWCENKLDKKHLYAYEQLWINKTRNCCNTCPAFQPLKKELRRQYEQQPVRKELRRQYDQQPVRRQMIKYNSRDHYASNKLEINEKKKIDKITCEKCGSTVRRSDIARHRKSKKCMSAV